MDAPAPGVLRPTAASAVEVFQDAYYSRIVLNVPNSQASFRQDVEAAGDHLHVEELVGRKQAYVRLGPKTNPWLPLVQRATYHRRFDRFTVRIEDDALTTDVDLGLFRVSLLVSVGPVVEWPEESSGVSAGFLCRRLTATTVVAGLFSTAAATTRLAMIGKHGGTLILKNTDLANDLYFRYGNPAVTVAVDTTFFRLEAGESVSLPLRSLVNQLSESVLVGTVSGTCECEFMASAGAYDGMDPANVSPAVL